LWREDFAEKHEQPLGDLSHTIDRISAEQRLQYRPVDPPLVLGFSLGSVPRCEVELMIAVALLPVT
jgi:surfactin synthase thioesterase subunit